MTKAGIDYIRGMYQTALQRRAEADAIKNEFSRGHQKGYHSSTLDLCCAVAEFEKFSLEQSED